ncbi:MAG: autotransporter-associated beta strand repeat-containing protein, partial [Pirellulales bacterium]
TSLTKDGPGQWRLTGSSTYTGTTQILNGTVSLAVNAQSNLAGGFGLSTGRVLLGNAAAGASGTAAILLEQGVTVSRGIDIASSAGSQVVSLGGSHTAGISSFVVDTPVRLGAGRTVALLAASSGTSQGTVRFNNVWQDSTGGTNVTNNFTVGGTGFGGIVEIGNPLATAGSVSVLNGRLAVRGSTEQGSLSAGGGVLINGAGAELKFNSTTPLTSPVTLTQGILSGTGAINAAVTPGGVAAILSPGNSPGIMPFGTSQTWNSFTYLWETNNFTGTTAGTDFDRITIAGGLSLTGTTSGAYVLDITSLTALNELGIVPNFDEQARSWTILTTTGGITGFDATRWTLNTANFSTSPAWQTNGSFSIATANAGNDLVLNFVVVPEPASAAIAGIGIVVAAWVGYRRRR